MNDPYTADLRSKLLEVKQPSGLDFAGVVQTAEIDARRYWAPTGRGRPQWT